ncbi:hypothetical protein [Thermoproteus tenax]|uniref:Energy-coupling factor transporter transmembrane protein EcfT n=1 Tax=Thermoproteus tenax (strain ATCC 35583 / DSM 2078 / JCM 9277 / NBRC 100435 / Kra 1) TaxID=768679 RepID=G4RK56_THETK|nr:hypothetical protein [Thermoproteus tenax]CCC81951.1 conserved hypothetical protein [Thermoproteus tenax Kra 1]
MQTPKYGLAKLALLLLLPAGWEAAIGLAPLLALHRKVAAAAGALALMSFVSLAAFVGPAGALLPTLTLFKNLAVLGLLFNAVSPGEVVWALKRIGVKGQWAYVIPMSLRASSVISREVKTLLAVAKARGARGPRAVLQSALPLLVFIFDYAEYLEVQIRQRSFECLAERPPYFTKWDILLIASAAASLLAAAPLRAL